MVCLISLAANQPDSRLEPERAGNLLLRPAGAPPSCWASQRHATCGTSGIQSFLSAYAPLLFLSLENIVGLETKHCCSVAVCVLIHMQTPSAQGLCSLLWLFDTKKTEQHVGIFAFLPLECEAVQTTAGFYRSGRDAEVIDNTHVMKRLISKRTAKTKPDRCSVASSSSVKQQNSPR